MFACLRWVAAGCFLVVAALQYNDPDPWNWIALYLAAAAISLLQQPGRRWAIPPLLLGTLASIWALTLVPGATGVTLTDLPRPMHTKGGAVEHAREAGGLTLLAIWMFVLSFQGHRTQNK